MKIKLIFPYFLLGTAFLITATGSYFIAKNFTQVLTQTQSSKITIASTIFPLYDMVKNIGGDKVQSTLILPPGASPHTFDLRPSDVKKINDAQVVFAIGHGLDNWIYQNVLDQGAKKVTTVDNHIGVIKRNGEDDPHYWLNVENAKIIAQNIAQTLINNDPKNLSFYLKSLADYLVKLDQLELKMAQTLMDCPNNCLVRNRNLVTFHDAWYYFASEFRFNILASFEPFPGKEPSALYLNEFENEIRKANVNVIYSEPQIPTDLLTPVANDLGLKISILDPIEGISQQRSYIDSMLYNMNEIINNQ